MKIKKVFSSILIILTLLLIGTEIIFRLIVGTSFLGIITSQLGFCVSEGGRGNSFINKAHCCSGLSEFPMGK